MEQPASQEASFGTGLKRGADSEPQCDSSFDCVVCQELLVDPVVNGACGHDMCKVCYERWQRVCRGPFLSCPLCRAPMPSTLGVCLRLKNTIEALHPEASKRRRAELGEIEEPESTEPLKQCMSAEQAMHDMSASYAQWQWQWAASMQFAMHYMQQQAAPFGVPAGPAVAAAMGGEHGAERSNRASCDLEAVGTPVVDIVCQQRAMAAAALQDSSCRPQWCTPAAAQLQPSPMEQDRSSEAGEEEHMAAVPPAAQGAGADVQRTRWQSVADVPLRLECARAIMRLVQLRGLHQVLGPAALPAVRSVEVALYRTAPSREAYCDMATLETRMVHMIRQRASQAAARRAGLHRAAQAPAAPVQAGPEPAPPGVLTALELPPSPRAAAAARIAAV